MKHVVDALDSGEVLFVHGENGAGKGGDGWVVSPAAARAAADRLSRAGVVGETRALLWTDPAGPVWWQGEPDSLRRVADALRHAADIAEAKTAVKQ